MGKVKLRDYQNETLDALRAKLKEGHRYVMLYAPTGAGKTEMAISLLEAANDKGNRAAMILDRIVLCDQTSARLTKYAIDHGVMQAGHWRNRPYERIQVCSAQTLEKRGSFPGLKLMVIDEAHATRQQTIKFLKNNKDIVAIGLSASPFTKGLGEIYSSVVGATTTAKLVDEGNLVPLRVFIAKEVDMSGAKSVAGEWTQEGAAAAAMKITGDIVTEWRDKCQAVFGGPRKTIVFCSSIAHGADLVKAFAEQGFNFVQISYEDTDEFKRDAVADFSRPDTAIHGLVACDILTKGFDVPDVMVGVSARPFKKSFSSHVQQMGRVMRPWMGKEYGLWLDHSGNYLRFQDKWEDLFHNGVGELPKDGEKAVKERSDEEKERSKCPACHALWVGRGRTCANCGHVKPVYSTVEQVKGVMEELSAPKKPAVSLAERERWYREIRTIMRGRGKDDGFAAMRFKDKFGAFPPWEWRNHEFKPVAVSPEVASFEQSRRIAWARRKSA